MKMTNTIIKPVVAIGLSNGLMRFLNVCNGLPVGSCTSTGRGVRGAAGVP